MVHWYLWSSWDRYEKTHELLYCLNSSFYLLCVCEGDFNKVLELNEKIGGRVWCLDAIADFWQVPCDYNSIYMDCSRYLFMWSNRHFGSKKLIGERLYRFLYSHYWQELNKINLIRSIPPPISVKEGYFLFWSCMFLSQIY